MTSTGAFASGTASWSEETIAVGAGQVRFARSGDGPPLLVLPRDNGHAPKNPLLDSLASSRTVYFPWLPGFHGGGPGTWDWLTNVRDVAIVVRQLVATLGLGRPAVAGLGFGGWVAAEMASMGPADYEALILVGPMGVQPKDAYIYDQFIVSTEAYARTAFVDQAVFESLYGQAPELEQLEAWETDREMTSRVAWKPYMYNPALPRLLHAVATPTLIVFGEHDALVPVECGSLYRGAIPGSTLEVIAGAGHAVDIEQPAAVAGRVSSFLNSIRR
jgi:pimeloyl-ACP methyl ester carboxylesterase